MLLKSSKSFPLRTTTLAIILLQTLTTIHVASSPVRLSEPSSSSDLNLLLDPIYQSEQDNQLETKRVVPKSVYNTVIRVTTTPCSSGSQRFKEGGPCVTRYTGSGPVLDEEFQLSILKGITSLGGIGGSRRPSNNRNRNRHRSTTTTTPMPTTEPEMTTTTNDEEELLPESTSSESDDIRKVGNVEILDIEVDSIDSKPELSPTPGVSASMITSHPIIVAPLAPKPGPRPASTPMPATPITFINGSNTENAEGTNLPDEDLNPNPVSLSPSSPSPSIIDPISVTFPKSGPTTEIKDDEDGTKTTDAIIDFSTTMMPTMEDSINVSFDENPTQSQEGDNQEEATTDVTSGQPLQLAQSSVMPMGQNVMVNQGQDEEDKGTIKPSESDFNITPQDPVLTMVGQNDEISEQFTPEPEEALLEIIATTSPSVKSTNPLKFSSTPAPVSLIIPVVSEPELEPLPEILSPTNNPTPLNFTEEKVNSVVMMDSNTRLPDLNVDSDSENVDTQELSAVTTPASDTGRLIQISDFEMDPITSQEHQLQPSQPSASLSLFSEMMSEENADVKLENDSSEPNSDETLTVPNSSFIHTPPEPEAPTSLAQEILSKLRPISQIPSSTRSEASPSQEERRFGFFPDLVLDELESDLRNGGESRQAEIQIDQSHHRSRSRNRVKSSETVSPSSTSLIPPSHHHWGRSMTSMEKVGGGGLSLEEREGVSSPSIGRHFPQNLAPSSPLDYSRLGDNYRRFRVF